MARSDVRTTAKRIRRQMKSAHRSEAALLATDLDADDTTVAFDGDISASVKTNTILNINLELMRVKAEPDRSANTVEVTRGWEDSEPAAHVASDEIAINPRFSLIDIYEEMVSELESWGPSIFQVAHSTFAVTGDTQTIELPIDWIGNFGIIDVRRFFSDTHGGTSPSTWPTVQNWNLMTSGAGVVDAATTSGLLLRIGDGLATGYVHVTVALPLSMQDALLGDDLIDDIGLPSSSLDLLELGVRIRLLSQSEIGRSARQAQGDARRAEENPPGSIVPVLQLMERQYARRMMMEQRKFYARHPLRFG